MRPPAPHCSSKHGFTFLEVIVSASMLAVLLATVGQLAVSAKRHARAVQRHTTAMRAVENCLEDISNRPWDEIVDEAIAAYELPDELQQRWPKAQLTGSVKTATEPVASKQITLRLSPGDDPRMPTATLTTWVFRKPNG